MTEWIIQVIGKRRKEIDKHLLVQAVLMLARQLQEQEQAAMEAGAHTGREKPEDEPEGN